MKIDIKFTTVTPLCQMANLEKKMIDGAEVNYQAIQKLPMFIEMGDEKVFVKLPVFTANGFRGMLRRAETSILYKKAIEKGLDLGKNKNTASMGKSFFAQNAGGNVSYTNASLKEERDIREANPVVSMLGASLAVSGKLGVSPMFPKEKDLDGNLVYPVAKSNGENTFYYPKCTYIHVRYKHDDLKVNSENSKLFSFEQLDAWEKEVAASKVRAKELKEKQKSLKDKNEKEQLKKDSQDLTVGHVITNEEVCAGTDFYGSIVSTDVLTDIEKGLLIRSLIDISKKEMGALNSIGRGKVNYEIVFGESVIRSEWNEFKSSCSVHVTLDKEMQGYVDVFNEWLENIEEKNIQISEMLDKIGEK